MLYRVGRKRRDRQVLRQVREVSGGQASSALKMEMGG